MILLTLAVGVIRGNDIVIRPAEIRPPCIQLDTWNQKDLPVLVDGALYDLLYDADTNGLNHATVRNVFHIFPRGTDINDLSVKGVANVLTAFPDLREPFLICGSLPFLSTGYGYSA